MDFFYDWLKIAADFGVSEKYAKLRLQYKKTKIRNPKIHNPESQGHRNLFSSIRNQTCRILICGSHKKKPRLGLLLTIFPKPARRNSSV